MVVVEKAAKVCGGARKNRNSYQSGSSSGSSSDSGAVAALASERGTTAAPLARRSRGPGGPWPALAGRGPRAQEVPGPH